MSTTELSRSSKRCVADEWLQDGEPVPVVITPLADGAVDRLVAAFPERDGFAVPLDADRPANRPLLEAAEFVIIEGDDATVYRSRGHEPAGAATVRELSHRVGRAISGDTEVLHVTPEDADGPPYLMAMTDGSCRARSGLVVAEALGAWLGLDVEVGATADADGSNVLEAILRQLDDFRLPPPEWISPERLGGWIDAVAHSGGVLVASAFGSWDAPSNLQRLTSTMIGAGLPAVVGVGPRVDENWRPRHVDPIIIAVDGEGRAEDVVDALGWVLMPARASVSVVHAGPAPDVDGLAARRVAQVINRRWGLPVRSETVTVAGGDPVEAIVHHAEAVHAQCIVTHSWHRPIEGRPTVASRSAEIVAGAPCPVVVLSAPTPTP